MNVLDVAAEVIDALNSRNAGYMLVGSLSTNLYGIPRNTNDADFVLAPQTVDANTVAAILGPAYRLDPQTAFRSITLTSRQVLTHTETGFLIEFFGLSEDAHDRERFKRRLRIDFLNRWTYVPTVEDVIITKLRWAMRGKRPKDISDVKSILAVQQSHDLDLNYLIAWVTRHGTAELFNQLLTKTPRV